MSSTDNAARQNYYLQCDKCQVKVEPGKITEGMHHNCHGILKDPGTFRRVPVPTRVYIAGPMTSYPEHNYPAFEEAAKNLRALGYEVLTPCEINRMIQEEANPDGSIDATQYARCMAADLKYVIEWADEVAVLDGWISSRGAKLEVHIAQVLNKPVWFVREASLAANKRIAPAYVITGTH